MRFFDRTQEIKLLKSIEKKSQDEARFTVLTGRRRIGKTSLVTHAFGEERMLYFFVARKTETELCRGYQKEIQSKLNLSTLGKATSFEEIFEFLMVYSYDKPITLFIDEFQEFFTVNPSIYSAMQRIWDMHKSKAKINLIVGGSINSLMNKIFRDKKEPLFQRETNMIKLKPFTPEVLKEILKYYHPEYTANDLLALYSFTGGVAKYVELIVDNRAFDYEAMIDLMVSEDSIFIEEGRVMLIGEFGKSYNTYFTILSAVASGRTSRSQIADVVDGEIGGYITKLEHDYGLMSKNQPILEHTSNKSIRYVISDNFLSFWFRFIYKYNYLTEISNYKMLREIIKRDYKVFSGKMLERYFKEKLIESCNFTRIGGWWDRKGENEIDLVGINEFENSIHFYEIKRNPEKINLKILEDKAKQFFDCQRLLNHFSISYKGLSLEDM